MNKKMGVKIDNINNANHLFSISQILTYLKMRTGKKIKKHKSLVGVTGLAFTHNRSIPVVKGVVQCKDISDKDIVLIVSFK